MSTRKHLAAALCALAISAPLSAAKRPAPVTLDTVIKKVQEQQKNTRTLQASFRQEKELALLAAPEVSTGTFSFSKPSNVLWSYDAPKRVQMLIANAGHTVSSDRLLMQVWGHKGSGDRQLLKQLVHRLRQKIEIDPAAPEMLQTAPGAGYKLVVE